MNEELAKKFELLNSIKTGNAPDRTKLFRKIFFLAEVETYYAQHLYTKKIDDKKETAIDIYRWSLKKESIDINALISTAQKYMSDVQVTREQSTHRFRRSGDIIKFIYSLDISWALLNYDVKQKGNFYKKL